MIQNRSQSDQAARFREAASEVEADQADDALDQIMGKLDLTKKPEPEPKPPSKK